MAAVFTMIVEPAVGTENLNRRALQWTHGHEYQIEAADTIPFRRSSYSKRSSFCGCQIEVGTTT